MPLAAMMMAVPRTSLMARDSSTERVSLNRAVWSGHVPERIGLGRIRVEILGVRAVEPGRLDGHRAVHEGRQLRDAAGVLERPEMVDELLGPADGEGRDDERAAAVDRRPHRALELVGHGRGVVTPVPVGRFHEHVVGFAQRLRVEENGHSVAAQVPREDDTPGGPVSVEIERDGRGAEDVSRPSKGRPHARHEPDGLVVRDTPDSLGSLSPLLRGIERQRGRVLRGSPGVVVGGLLLLEVAGVRQHDPREVRGPAGSGDASPEAILDEPGQVADVVDVGVGQRDGVDLRRVDRQPIPVPESKLLQPLVKTAVDEKLLPTRLDQELRAGDRPRGAQAVDRRRARHGHRDITAPVARLPPAPARPPTARWPAHTPRGHARCRRGARPGSPDPTRCAEPRRSRRRTRGSRR